MIKKIDPFDFNIPIRPNYELYNSILWGTIGFSSLTLSYFSQNYSVIPLYSIATTSCAMSLKTVFSGINLYRKQKHINGVDLTFMTLEQLTKHLKKNKNDLWLGFGFEWESKHTQLTYAFSLADQSLFKKNKFFKKDSNIKMGKGWIHGIEPNEIELWQNIKHTEGHSLIVGTTGAGKTRMFDLLIAQAILRNEAVIIIDPKGDQDLSQKAQMICEEMGEKERFAYFNPAFPEKSFCIDPLHNFSRTTELASRISALMPSDSGTGSAFKAFSWQALNNIIQALIICGERPSLINIKHYLESGTATLVSITIKAYTNKVIPDYSVNHKDTIDKVNSWSDYRQADYWKNFYYEQLVRNFPNSDIEGLISMFIHDQTHFSKMVAGLLPIMNMLTSGLLGAMLSPNPESNNEKRLILDTTRLINNKQIAYLGLDSLTDGMVGSAIGSLILSDLTAVAGDRYNYGVNNHPVNVFVDEAAEVINEPFIQLLNKGRGAGIRLFIATQTFADFAARLGNTNKATQVLANVNNIFALRVTDVDTQKYITDKIPKTRIKVLSHSQTQQTGSEQPLNHSGSQAEMLREEEADLFPPALLGQLPNLEFIAAISGGRLFKGRIPILTTKNNSK